MSPPRNLYFRYGLFLLPLVITVFVHELTVQWITGGLSRLPLSVEILASFGLAWAWVSFLNGPLLNTKQIGLVLVERRQAFWKALHFILLIVGVITGIQGLLAFTDLGVVLLRNLHQVSADTTRDVQTMLQDLLLLPLLTGCSSFLAGPLIRNHQTRYVSLSSVSGFVAVMVSVALLLPLARTQAQPTLLPVFALYAGKSCELCVVIVGILKHRQTIWTTPLHPNSHRRPLTFGGILQFYWPLAGIILLQEFSRPLINLVIARQPEGEIALAVLAVVYALGQWPYRWLNETRTIAPAFQWEDPTGRTIRRFNGAAGLISLALSMLLYWTPLRNGILESLLELEADFAARCIPPLMLFAAYSPVVAVRSYMHGIGLVERRTSAMMPSAPVRLLAIMIALVVLPVWGLYGALLGVATLLCGFAMETLILVVRLRGPALHTTGKWSRSQRPTPAANSPTRD